TGSVKDDGRNVVEGYRTPPISAMTDVDTLLSNHQDDFFLNFWSLSVALERQDEGPVLSRPNFP
ncbi:hypothetical protein WG66_013667, partial [Moniliophthora roreri]